MQVASSVVSVEDLCDVLIEIKDLQTISLGSVCINIGDHPTLGKIIGISTDSDKAALLRI
jgi:hypothetical protein